ncbi:unnamed protein product [Coccothraustes coccothraustes]
MRGGFQPGKRSGESRDSRDSAPVTAGKTERESGLFPRSPVKQPRGIAWKQDHHLSLSWALPWRQQRTGDAPGRRHQPAPSLLHPRRLGSQPGVRRDGQEAALGSVGR